MSAKNLKAVGRWVLVRPGTLPECTPGGIFYNPAWQQKPTDGIVLSVGGKVPEHVRDILMPANQWPGAKVLFSWIHGTDIEHDGQVLKLIDWQELNGVVEPREIINRPGNQDNQ